MKIINVGDTKMDFENAANKIEGLRLKPISDVSVQDENEKLVKGLAENGVNFYLNKRKSPIQQNVSLW